MSFAHICSHVGLWPEQAYFSVAFGWGGEESQHGGEATCLCAQEKQDEIGTEGRGEGGVWGGQSGGKAAETQKGFFAQIRRPQPPPRGRQGP